jgi:Gas vesicle protein
VTTLQPTSTSIIDVLDRVLDKGVVVDGWVRVSLVGIDLITLEMRIIVASIDTYLRHADDIAHLTRSTSVKFGGFGGFQSSGRRPIQH